MTTTPTTEPRERTAPADVLHTALDMLGEAAPDLSLTCREADAVADLFRSVGRDDDAGSWIDAHAANDDEGDDHYQEPDGPGCLAVMGGDHRCGWEPVAGTRYCLTHAHQDPDRGRERGPASLIRPGDYVRVFAHPAPYHPGSRGDVYPGRVVNVTPVDLAGTTDAGVRVEFESGALFDAVHRAVTTWVEYHDARPTDDPDDTATCRDCGRPVTWVGPNVETDWWHVTDPRNT